MACITLQEPNVRRYVKQLMKEAGLTIREDPMGNIYGRMHGRTDTAGTTTRPDHPCRCTPEPSLAVSFPWS